MLWPLLLALAGFAAVNLLVNALVLRLACQAPWARGDHPAVGYGRALLLVLLIALVAWPLLAAVAFAGREATGAPAEVVARYAAPPLSFVVPVAVLRLGLRAGWLRTLLVWLIWRLATLAQAGLALLAGRWLLLNVFADELPPGWRDWLG
jgi:hypothetical protein